MVDEQFKQQVDAYVDEVWEDVVADIDRLVRHESVEDLSAAIRARMLEEDTVPEPFRSEDGQVFWPDLW